MAMFEFFTSLVSAKPYNIICTTGIHIKMNSVRRSLQIWSHSFFTKIKNCFIVLHYPFLTTKGTKAPQCHCGFVLFFLFLPQHTGFVVVVPSLCPLWLKLRHRSFNLRFAPLASLIAKTLR